MDEQTAPLRGTTAYLDWLRAQPCNCEATSATSAASGSQVDAEPEAS